MGAGSDGREGREGGPPDPGREGRGSEGRASGEGRSRGTARGRLGLVGSGRTSRAALVNVKYRNRFCRFSGVATNALDDNASSDEWTSMTRN